MNVVPTALWLPEEPNVLGAEVVKIIGDFVRLALSRNISSAASTLTLDGRLVPVVRPLMIHKTHHLV